MKRLLYTLTCLFLFSTVFAEDGYRLWLRYEPVQDAVLLNKYKQQLQAVTIAGNSPTIHVLKEELQQGLQGLLKTNIPFAASSAKNELLIGVPAFSAQVATFIKEDLAKLGTEGFIIKTVKRNSTTTTIITGNTDIALLYGTFHFLRLMQTQQSIADLNITSIPKLQRRILDHWDNLNRTVERGYAGLSIWDWHTLPGYIDVRYKDYARANASVGINGVVLNNVNANAIILTHDYLLKVQALANVFRPYGIKVYLTARFSAPIEIGGLKTADPLDKEVQKWWADKANEIYKLIPDFGGFLVKANSEGQPGPQNYNRSHADGANTLADALLPHNGIVMWRAFVYSNEAPEDRFKQAYNEFKPLDGQFRKNVIVQVKNGPIDFQPREPFHPLFGAMPGTPLMMEFQLTQEYLGFATHLVFLPSLFKEVLDANTHANGGNLTVAQVIEGKEQGHTLTGMAGVANIGNARNWCGHPFGQANWFGFGRLAWDNTISNSQIANEWLRMTFTNDPQFTSEVSKLMLASREILVDYMTPLGLHHIMGYNHHYGPGPWVNTASRPDWNSVYYHKADSTGIGFDRTATGSNALSQYAPEVSKQFETLATCPPQYLLWFHHVSWDYRLANGHTLWNELCYKYYAGADSVRWMQRSWASVKGKIDEERFEQVRMLLNIQADEAAWWRDACVLYFQSISNRPIPGELPKPTHTLEYYKGLKFPFAPGI